MGGVAKVLSFVRQLRRGANVTDVKVNPGGGANLVAEHFSTPGDDSHPLPNDYAVLVPVQQTGRVAAVGYIDPANEQAAAAGERRLYSRDSDGNIVATIWIKNDGEVLVENDAASLTMAADGSVTADNGSGAMELQAGGDVIINGVTIAVDGSIDTPTGIITPSAVVNGVEVDQHTHAQPNDSAGNTESPTGPML